MLLTLRYRVLVDYSPKKSMIQDNQCLQKKIEDIDKKIPNTCGLVEKIYYNTKITEVGNRILSVTRLVTTVALNAKATEIEKKKKYLILLI